MARLGALSILNGDLRAQLKCLDMSSEDTVAFRDAWRRVYARPLKRRYGVWHRGKYDWHVFSFGDTFALALNDARRAYLAQPRSELIILPNDTNHTGVRTGIVQVPPLDGEADIYISPPSLAWTMVYTHEDGWCGPYFSRAEWVDHPPSIGAKHSSKDQNDRRRKKTR